MSVDFRPGDRVRVAQRWATKPERPLGTVKEIITSRHGGAWVAVRFDGQTENQMHMARELEPGE